MNIVCIHQNFPGQFKHLPRPTCGHILWWDAPQLAEATGGQ